ncbi:hypothetical protein [Brunnivagina elsteri]|uniref:Uncharacterized protein n=1 Tax=Brunnivagina elsteri CCALA 953 TaxID=987040 RepID=A0A2A2TJS1_9CYAN|nr:hypothetical protein [Calothrix elsteri]PAX55850.1 hypothetical protein CK510_11035 [Calothrix elsteri CCALA 953]
MTKNSTNKLVLTQKNERTYSIKEFDFNAKPRLFWNKRVFDYSAASLLRKVDATLREGFA